MPNFVQSPPLILLPQPKTLIYQEGTYTPPAGLAYTLDETRIRFTIADSGADFDIASDKYTYQEYSLTIAPEGISIRAASRAGAFYALCTLHQIAHQAPAAFPCLTITDRPDFARRGVMLDIARDKVPTISTLKTLIDLLASWKINELQLYTEHTFAYKGHESVWKDASPFTGDEIRELDAYCKARFIDLVPNQNSFGHFHRWLKLDAYRDLAEYPEGFDWPIFLEPRPFSLNVSDPRTMALLSEMYADLLPNFSSRYFNVGCDETFDLGKGRTKALVEAEGVGRVYLGFLQKIAALVRANGQTMQFWGDIIMKHPELIPELPAGGIALEWGYDADHPFNDDGAQFAAAGIPFYVCPGTSSWISLVGRTDNAIANLKNAAINGLKHGAIGYLNTDWGDFGHWQPLPVSYLGFAAGAALSWAVESNLPLVDGPNSRLTAALNMFAFKDSAGVLGPFAYEVGNIYRMLDDQRQFNGSLMARANFSRLDKIPEEKWLSGPLSIGKLRAALAAMEQLRGKLDVAHPLDRQIVADYKLAIALWMHGCKRLLLVAGDTSITAAALLHELRPLRLAFEEAWLTRNRPGGLRDSLERMDRLIREYQALTQ